MSAMLVPRRAAALMRVIGVFERTGAGRRDGLPGQLLGDRLEAGFAGLGEDRERVAEVADLLFEAGRGRDHPRQAPQEPGLDGGEQGQRGADDDDEERGVHGREFPDLYPGTNR